MTRWLLLLLFAPVVGWAQTPLCFPMVNGVHSGLPRHMSTDLGEHVFWYCAPRVDAKPNIYGFSCLKGQCSRAALETAVGAITRASARLTTAQAQWTAAVTFDCAAVEAEESPRGELCRERVRIVQAFGWEWFIKGRQ